MEYARGRPSVLDWSSWAWVRRLYNGVVCDSVCSVVVGDLIQPGRLCLWDVSGNYELGFRRLHVWISHLDDLVYWIRSSWAWVQRLYSGAVGESMRSVVAGDLILPGRLVLWNMRGHYVLGFRRLHLWIRPVGDFSVGVVGDFVHSAAKIAYKKESL